MAVVTVTELVLNFAEACRALIPALDRAEVPWRDAAQYDNWDRIAEPLFETLVTEPCAFQAAGEPGLGSFRLARYGFSAIVDWNAWVAVEGDGSSRMIDLSSVELPFDHVRCEPDRLVPLNDASFAFIHCGSDGIPRRLEAVDLAAE